jgi:hypothetical protein
MYICPACKQRMGSTACAPSTGDLYYCELCRAALATTDEGFRVADGVDIETAARAMVAVRCPLGHQHIVVAMGYENPPAVPSLAHLSECPGESSAWLPVLN